MHSNKQGRAAVTFAKSEENVAFTNARFAACRWCGDILHLREFHKQMDETVLKAYGWEDIDIAHDFYEVDYLPENDRAERVNENETPSSII